MPITFDINNPDPQTNFSNNREFADVVNVNMSRRRFLQGSAAIAATAFIASCSSATGTLRQQPAMAFTPITVGFGDEVVVPAEYQAQAFLPWGTPLLANAAEYRADGSNTGAEQEQQVGAHHDGMHFFPIDAHAAGTNSTEGLLVMNHEYVDPAFIHANGPDAPPRPADQVRKEIAAHGVSVAHIKDVNGEWQLLQTSSFNRRITGATEMELVGPAAGHPKLSTLFSPSGTRTRGTLNNCAHGHTPWGTYLTCEENWARCFVNQAEHTREQQRYGVAKENGRYYWETATPSADEYARFDVTPYGNNANEDYRNEANGFGWIVEIDPFNPNSMPKKHTALGRFAHEGIVFAAAEEGKPLVAYSGDDSRFEYIYKFVSAEVYNHATAGSHLLEEGTLYVARFNDDGSGEWLPLDIHNAAFQAAAAAANVQFSDQGDVLLNTRLAADIMGATKMDRPEWGAVHPLTGEVYFTLTNNTRRTEAQIDAANPRAENYAGHIIRWQERADHFTWDIFMLGGAPGTYTPDTAIELDATNHHACADGLWFDSAGLLWIQTDMSGAIQGGSTYGNNAMLVANPDTREVKRFLTGPVDCEITGVVTTPDRKTMFINVQHPGEGSTVSNPSSHWPDGGSARPRSSTVVIRHNEGKVIGS
ncbi:MAG: PhoX family phosphatase [Idiomarina sp.]|nr:PhoX family phosphatase [Idiomarina sp.]